MERLTSNQLKYVKAMVRRDGPDAETALYLITRLLLHMSEEESNRICKHPEEIIEHLLETQE